MIPQWTAEYSTSCHPSSKACMSVTFFLNCCFTFMLLVKASTFPSHSCLFKVMYHVAFSDPGNPTSGRHGFVTSLHPKRQCWNLSKHAHDSTYGPVEMALRGGCVHIASVHVCVCVLLEDLQTVSPLFI